MPHSIHPRDTHAPRENAAASLFTPSRSRSRHSRRTRAPSGAQGVGAAAVAQVQAHVVGNRPRPTAFSARGRRAGFVEVAVNPEVGDVKKLRIGDTVIIQYRNARSCARDEGKVERNPRATSRRRPPSPPRAA